MTKATCKHTITLDDDRTLVCELDRDHGGLTHEQNGEKWGDSEGLPAVGEPASK